MNTFTSPAALGPAHKRKVKGELFVAVDVDALSRLNTCCCETDRVQIHKLLRNRMFLSFSSLVIVSFICNTNGSN
jgi:hypothetical protein